MGDETTVRDVREEYAHFERQRLEPRSVSWYVGGIVRKYREEHNLSQADVAEDMRRAGVDWFPETVAKVEAGKREISIGELVALGLMLELRPGDLLDVLEGWRVRLGKNDQWVPGRVVQSWADGDRWPMYRYGETYRQHEPEGIAPLAMYGSHVEDARIRQDDPNWRKVSAALHRWAADEAEAGREVDRKRWAGKEAQLWQAMREGRL